MGLAEVLELAAREPASVGVFSDFDGTLSFLAPDPETVEPAPGAVDALLELEAAIGRVAVVSGRPIDFLERHVPEAIDCSGLYGLEWRVSGIRGEHDDADGWRATIAELIASARGEFGEDAVEDKGISMTLHYRRAEAASGTAEAMESWAAAAAAITGLHARPAKKSIELHPPIEQHKGDAVASMARSVSALVYLGDDVGDLPAWRELTEGVAEGRYVACATVLVRGTETPSALFDEATDVVDGPIEAIALLNQLIATAQGAAASS